MTVKTEIISEIEKRLNENKGFEIVYEDNRPTIRDVKGITKSKISKKEIKGIRRKKTKLKKDIKELILNISRKLVDHGVEFKVLLWPKVVEIRFDLDYFISVYEGEVKIAGFISSEEKPLSYIFDILKNYGKIVFLKPLK